MSQNQTIVFIQTLHLSWVTFLHELHWKGTIDAYLSKGYASFKLTDEEKKKWQINNVQEDRIREILQNSIDEVNSQTKKNELLRLLASVDSINLPNQQEGLNVIDEMHKESSESNQSLLEIASSFIDPLLNDEEEKLEKRFMDWQGRSIRTIFHKGMSLLVDELNKKEIFYSYSTIEDITSKSEGLQPFFIMLYFYFNKYPDNDRLEIFKHFLLQYKPILTDCIDGIIYRSWKAYPNEMFVLTKEWIDSKNPILVNWLIHGVEVPGRKDALKAFNFLKTTFLLDDDEVAFIVSHVSATILCADPHQTFHFFEQFMEDSKNTLIKERLKQSLLDIITDKFVNKNLNEFDFPDLEKIIFNKMQEWSKSTNTHLKDISEAILEEMYKI